MERSLLARPLHARAPRQPFSSPRLDRKSGRSLKSLRFLPPAALNQRPANVTCSSSRSPCAFGTSRQGLGPQIQAAIAASIAAAALMPGYAVAEDAAAQEPALPPLPTPPEVVRSLQNQLIGSPPEEAPPLKDDAEEPAQQEASPEEQQRDQQLEERMQKKILPKIREQLKGLDQNEHPNSTTIELKRRLRRVEDDILRLLDDLKEHKSDEAHAEASGLQREFEDIRDFVLKNGGELVPEDESNAD